MKDWPKVRIDEIGIEFGDAPFGTKLKTKDYVDEGVPVVQGRNIKNNRFEWNQHLYVTEEKFQSLKKSHCREGDLVFPKVGTIGITAIMPKVEGRDTFLLSTNMMKMSVDPTRADIEFVYHYFTQESVRASIRANAGGSSQPIFNFTTLKRFELTLPPLPVQRQIAGILSAYDELIENSYGRIKILETLARTLYREWFVHFRFPGHESHPRVASTFGEVPRGWEVKALGEVANIFRGRSYRSVDLADEGGLPFLNLKCLDRDGGFRRSGLKRYTGEFKGIHVAKKGDIIMAVTDMTQERRIVARAALVPTLDSEFGIFSMDLVRIEPTSDLPKPFLYSFLRYSSFADEVKQHANGANVLHLSPDRISGFRLLAPPTDLMRRFAGFVAPVLEEIDTLANKIDNLRRTRDLLLPRLLSGQVALDSMEP